MASHPLDGALSGIWRSVPHVLKLSSFGPPADWLPHADIKGAAGWSAAPPLVGVAKRPCLIYGQHRAIRSAAFIRGSMARKWSSKMRASLDAKHVGR